MLNKSFGLVSERTRCDQKRTVYFQILWDTHVRCLHSWVPELFTFYFHIFLYIIGDKTGEYQQKSFGMEKIWEFLTEFRPGLFTQIMVIIPYLNGTTWRETYSKRPTARVNVKIMIESDCIRHQIASKCSFIGHCILLVLKENRSDSVNWK